MITRAQSLAFWGALVQSAITLAVLPFVAFQLAISGGLTALLSISLAFGVRRGDRSAAWCLVILQALALTSHLLLVSYKGWGLKVLLLIVFVVAALKLQKQPLSTARNVWPQLVYELAFLQAAWTGIAVELSVVFGREAFGGRFGLWSFLDVAMLVALGVAVFKRKLWAAYSLTLYQVLNIVVELIEAPTAPEVSVSVGIAFLYGLGAFRMRQALREMLDAVPRPVVP